MAEYVLAGILHFTRGFDRAETDCAARCFTKHSYKPVSVLGKTICVIGAGGIGQEVAQLCATAGMRVVGTRRSPAAGAPPAPFAELSLWFVASGPRRRPASSTRSVWAR
jgi:phosphoglycerate dehydrogenase-like enzyme